MKQTIFTAICIYAFCFAALAQNTQKPCAEKNIFVVIDSAKFRYQKTGIDSLVTIYKKIHNELNPLERELENLSVKIKELNERIIVSSNRILKFQAESNNLKKLRAEYERKKKRIDLIYGKRKIELINSVNKKINKALNEFKEQKCYSFILDLAEVTSDFIFEDKTDVTDDFIQFYKTLYNKPIR